MKKVLEPERRFAFDMATDVFVGNTDVRLVSHDAGTELTSTTTVVDNNAFMRGIFVFMQGSFAGRTQIHYEKLKQLVENPK